MSYLCYRGLVRLEQEKNLEMLRQAALLLEAENQRLAQRVVTLERQLSQLKGESPEEFQLRIQQIEAQLAQARQELFGKSSEKRPRTTEATQTEKRQQHGHGRRPQPQLPIEEVVHDLDEPDKQCPKCGGCLQEMKEQFEESEEIEVIERRFVRKKHKRKKYRCGCHAHVETALGPPKLFEGARYSIDFAIEVVVQKYLDHLPLERQVRIMAREGLTIDSQTLWDCLERVARLLAPAGLALQEYVLSCGVVGADETPWWMMGGRGRRGSERWYLWALVVPNAVYCAILDSRSTDAARKVLGGYQGILMVDGYAAYASLRAEADFILVRCWAHVRREFIKAEASFPQAAEALSLIGQLYAVEAECPRGPEGDALRYQLRQEKSRPIVARIHEWALEQRALKESSLGKALTYLGGAWTDLKRFLDDPRIPLDNNSTERAERGPVVGRKNHYGSRSKRGAEVAGLLYSFIESAKLCGLNPKDYLRKAIHAALNGERIPLPHELVPPP